MNPILKNIIAVVLGWFIGSVVNMGLIVLGHSIFPIEGVDINDTAALSEVMPTLEYNYFIFPFLAHALGTFVGATIAGMIAANRKMTFAMVIGGLFFIFGIIAHNMISGPTWFTVFDLVAAYIPMAWLGGKLALKLSKKD
ncbi:hypothetical protein [uncultured Psychroserpens sp.]|uniref:hypothetical protein n=1 Tax=uncultured Psychroserpens sp. TaxID=255436 RepID=UPI00261C6F14|nr:hypothetical protein [uncultured Psychroserpens sp.]